MSWRPRQPGTNEGARTTRLTEEDLKALGLQFEPGANCPSCGHAIEEHSDLDCITVLMNAIKRAASQYAKAQEANEELGDLRELRRLVETWVNSQAGERPDAYQRVISHLNST